MNNTDPPPKKKPQTKQKTNKQKNRKYVMDNRTSLAHFYPPPNKF